MRQLSTLHPSTLTLLTALPAKLLNRLAAHSESILVGLNILS